MRVELTHGGFASVNDIVLSDASKALTSTTTPVYPKVYPSEAENVKVSDGSFDVNLGQATEVVADPIASLAVALLALSSADRARLVAMLLKAKDDSKAYPE